MRPVHIAQWVAGIGIHLAFDQRIIGLSYVYRIN